MLAIILLAKAFSIYPEFRILELTISPKILIYVDYNSFPDLFSDYLKTIEHLNLKL